MSYAAKYLQSRGQVCTIYRHKSLTMQGLVVDAPKSYISMKRSTKAVRNLAVREGLWEGLILASSELASGEIFSIADDSFIVQTVSLDHASGELAWFAAKANAFLVHKRQEEWTDGKGNIFHKWLTLNGSVPAFGEVVTYQLRQVDPGLLDNTRYLFQVSKKLETQLLDRFVYQEESYQVNSIDDAALPGVVRIQLGIDVRP